MSSSDLLSTPFKRGETETDRPFPKLVRKAPRRGAIRGIGSCHRNPRSYHENPGSMRLPSNSPIFTVFVTHRSGTAVALFREAHNASQGGPAGRYCTSDHRG